MLRKNLRNIKIRENLLQVFSCSQNEAVRSEVPHVYFNHFLFVFSAVSLVWSALKAVLRIRDVYPGSWFFSIPNPISDPGFRIQQQHQKRRGKIFLVLPFFVTTNIIKLKIIRVIVLFTEKFVNKISKIWVWEPGFRVKRAPDPDPQHWLMGFLALLQPIFFLSRWATRPEFWYGDSRGNILRSSGNVSKGNIDIGSVL